MNRTDRFPGRRVLLPLIATVCGLVVGAAAPAAVAVNYSYPATYTGSTAAGGTVQFETSSDGSSITLLTVREVPTSCATIVESETHSLSIASEGFSHHTTSGVNIEGSFPGPRQAQGRLWLNLSFPFLCSSDDVTWTATTPTPPRDTTAPQTSVKAGPSGRTSSHKAKFRFGANESGAKFECKLDGKKWSSCRSPKAYHGLGEGKHVFRVRARDAAGNVDSSPAKRSWRVS